MYMTHGFLCLLYGCMGSVLKIVGFEPWSDEVCGMFV